MAYASAQGPFQGVGQAVGQAFGQAFENAAGRFVDRGRNTIGDFFNNQGGGFGGNQNNGGMHGPWALLVNININLFLEIFWSIFKFKEYLLILYTIFSLGGFRGPFGFF